MKMVGLDSICGHRGIKAGGGGWGPHDTSHQEISAELPGKWEKRRKEKRETGEEKKENKKRGGWKLKMEGGKVTKWGENFSYFFFCFSLFKNQWNLFWIYEKRNFLPGKSISRQKRIQEKWLWLLWKIFLLCPCVGTTWMRVA